MSTRKKKTKNKTIYYFRCEFGAEVKDTLESMINAAWYKLNSTKERTFDIGDDRLIVGMKLNNRKAKLSYGNKDCTVLSVGLYEEGASASTIEKPSKSCIELEASTYDAPINKEYLDGEGFICVFGNHLVISPSSTLRAGAINRFLKILLDRGGYSEESNIMDILQIADCNAINTIENEGVSKISINAALYLPTVEYSKRTISNKKILSTLNKITHTIKSSLDLLRDDDTDSEILEKDGLNTRIEICHDGRISGTNVDTGQEYIKNTAKLLASTDVGGYVITTKKGTKLTNENIVLKHTIRVRQHGKSVDREEMWSKLIESLEKYECDGILEQ